MVIPQEYFRTQTVHRRIGPDEAQGVLSCGFLHKRFVSNSDRNLRFQYYGSLLLLSGEGVHIDDTGKEYPLSPGCFIQRIPGKLHSTHVKPDGKWLEFYICFGRGVFEALAQTGALNATQDVLYPGLSKALFDEFVRFQTALRTVPEENLPLMLAEAQRIVFLIYHLHWQNSMPGRDRELIDHACRLLGNPYQRMSVPQIAQELGVGYEKFRKLFKQKVGTSPGEYAVISRINAAKSMMQESGCSVKEAALTFGFSDPFTFARQFKKTVGVSPSFYKNMY